MSPRLDASRAGEYARKGLELALRELRVAPEQVSARRLVARASWPAADGPRIAFLTPRDWAVHVQWEAVIAQALRLRGADVRFITCGGGLEICDRVNTYEGPPPPCHTCTRYVEGSLDAHHLTRRALRDGWVNARDEWPELDELSLDELTDVEWDGIAVGKLIQIPLRWFLLRSVIDDDPLAALTARRFLRASRPVIAGLRAVLASHRPDVVVVLNGLFFFESIALELCRSLGIPTVCYERGFIINTILVHTRRPDLLLDVSEEWDRERERPIGPDEERRLDAYLDDRRLGRRTIDRYWGRDTHHDVDVDDTPGRVVSLFTNLTWDSAVLGQEVAFPGIHEWLTTTVGWFARHPEHRLLLRIHPAELKLSGKQTREPLGEFVRERCSPVPANVEIIDPSDPISSYALMEASDVGLVYTSTTGIELALLGKPVIVAGRTHYRGKGFTVDPASPAGYVEALDRVIAEPALAAPDPVLVRRYANLFFFTAPVRMDAVDEPVNGLTRLRVNDLSELGPDGDPDIDRVCQTILRQAPPSGVTGA